MNKKDDLLDSNTDQKKVKKPKRTYKKKTEQAVAVKVEIKDVITDQELSSDEIINVELYNEILSTLFNSLSNPIIRNEIKINENILKYTELQISNLFFLETILDKELTNEKMAKEFLQLTANIVDLALSVSKSPKKTRIEILEDRNLLIVTIINSCKGVERESLEAIRVVDAVTLQSLNDQISALSNFTTEEKNNNTDQSFNQTNNLNDSSQTESNTLKNANSSNLNNNIAELAKLGVLPEHPAANPNFYPFLTKPTIIPKLKKILAGMLIVLGIFSSVTIILSLFVKGPLYFGLDKDGAKRSYNFTLGSISNNWLILIVTVLLFIGFAYSFLRPAKTLREKYRLSYFVLGLLLFWMVLTMGDFLYQITDKFYSDFFDGQIKTLITKGDITKDSAVSVSTIVAAMKNLPNFKVFKIFTIVTIVFAIFPLIVILVLLLINPRIDRNKVMKANMEYQNAINAALSGKKYDIDPTLFDHDEPANKKGRKVNFSGRF